MQDPYKIAEFFQKGGIPYKPVIQGGGISNLQIEHIWVESQIPYANYRGAVIDEHGKTWLGLDTSIKVKDYQYNNPEDMFELSAVSDQLSGLRDEYLGQVYSPLLQGEGQGEGGAPTPLEYFKTKLSAISGQQSADIFKLTRTLPEEHLKILPSSMQIEPVKITNEYIEIPDELKHKVRITAADANKHELFTITLPAQKLSNQKLALSYEPETLEDQEIIDSYGGLDNTPAYLVRLRPVLKVNGERMVVANDGLPMGSDYSVAIELISPNGTEQVTSNHVVGNLSVIGLVAGKVPTTPAPPYQGGEQGEVAESLLYKEAMNYISRWNQAEDELASLLHLSISRPIPTVVTVGGVIDVTYLLDMPHGFEWKGVFMDAGLRRIETTPPSPLFDKEGVPQAGALTKLFMQLSALQGSVLENRIFEDDFKVESISTAKLLQISGQGAAAGGQILTIDKSNINSILPTLTLDEAIKEDITNSVNQNLTIKIPAQELTYENWSGIGYIKENPQTGEAGYMLSGMIAGGMNAIDKLKWYNQDIAQALSAPYTEAPNTTPSDAVDLKRITASDYQSDTAGEPLDDPLQVLARDKDGKAVKGVPITFITTAGGGELSGTDDNGVTVKGMKITIKTGWNGIANAYLTLGQHTDDSPYYANGDPYLILVGQNLISASAEAGTGTIYTDKPFEAYGYPGEAVDIIKTYGDSDETNNIYFYGLPNTLSSTIVLKITDQYDNPISNKKVKFTVEPQTFQFFSTSIPAPTGTTKNAKIFKNTAECPGVATLDCPNAVSELSDIYTDSSGALAYVILGNTDNTRYTVKAKTQEGTNLTAYFKHYISSVKTSDKMSSPKLSLISLAVHKNAAPPGALIEEPLTAVMRVTKEDYETQTVNCGENCYYIKGKGTFTTMPVNKGEVAFSINTGGGSVTPETVKYTETEITDGKYQTYLTLGSIPAQNKIYAKGKATISSPVANQTTGLMDFADTDLDSGTSFEIWGVKATVQPISITINGSGYPISDTSITYTIEPTTYKPQDLFIDFYEIGSDGTEKWFGFIQAYSNWNLVLNSGGAKFDINKAYKAELILNRGSSIEIRSEKVEVTTNFVNLQIKDLATPCESLTTNACVNSFIANRGRTGDRISVTGEAKQSSTDLSAQITWRCSDVPGDGIDSGTCNPETGTGATFTFIPTPPAVLTGRTKPLSYQIKAQITIGETALEKTILITQDNLDELRQEYEDLPQRNTQDRADFDQDTPAFTGLLGGNAEPTRHQWHILRSLNEHARTSNTNYSSNYGGNLNFTSGYRCPIGTSRLPNSTNTSNHQYGRAFDFNQGDSHGNYNGYLAVRAAGAAVDTYLQGSNGIRYFWDNRNSQGYPTWPAPAGITYIQGHAAW